MCYPTEIFKDQDILENFLCPINKGILQDPIMDSCGHSFCKSCIENYHKEKKNCPISENEIEMEDLIKNNIVLKIIENLEIFCILKKDGCKWEGFVKDLDMHIEEDCEYEKINCENNLCKNKIRRKDLEEHLKNCEFRKIECENCLKEEIFIKMPDHLKICENIQIECINNCQKKIMRKEMHFHIEKNCENTEVSCPFIGCKKKEKRKSIQDHLCSSIGYIYHQKILEKRIFKIEEKTSSICDFIKNYKTYFDSLPQNPHLSLQKTEFDTKNCHYDLIINKSLKKAVKISNENPSFVCITDFVIKGKVYKFRLKINAEISIGISTVENLQKLGFSLQNKVFVTDLFCMKFKKIEGFAEIELDFVYEESGSKIVVKNKSNNRTSSLLTRDISDGMFVVCFLLNYRGDSVEILE